MNVWHARVDMDAYDLTWKIKGLWAENIEKQSGLLPKTLHGMRVVINTPEGYRQVVGAVWNKDINSIELVLDKE
jgi:hypothetical protein